MSETGGSDTSGGPGWWQGTDGKWYPPPQGAAGEPTQVNPEATAAMPTYAAPTSGAPVEPEKKGMSTEAKWLIVGFVILAAIGIAGIVVSATSDDDTPTTTTVAVTTEPERPATSDRPEPTRAPTTEDRPATTVEEPEPTEAPPTTEAGP